MIIIGIDPGLALVGFAVLKIGKDRDEKPKVIDFGCIATSAGGATGERLKYIHEEVGMLIKKHKPDLMAIESLFFFKNAKTVMPVAEAKGVILLAAAHYDVPVQEFTPLQIKMTMVGYGRAEKKQVQAMTKQLLDLSEFDFKTKHRKKDDAADALGVALCASLHGVKN